MHEVHLDNNKKRQVQNKISSFGSQKIILLPLNLKFAHNHAVHHCISIHKELKLDEKPFI